MVTGVKVDGATPAISPGIRKTIQSIKEIVGNHSDADIYVALRETNMDPNETAQKLLNQDPFHEVKRKRSKNKEKAGNKGPTELDKDDIEVADQGTMFNSLDQNNQRDDNCNKDERTQRGGYNRRGGYNQRGSGVFHRGGYNRRGDDVHRGDIAHKFDEIHKNDGVQRDGGDQRDSGIPRHDDNQRDADAHYRDGNFRGVGFPRGGSFQRGDGFQRASGVRRGVTFQRDGFARNSLPANPVKGVEFRVVRDNRVNQNASLDASALPQSSSSNSKEAVSNVSAEGDTSETLKNQKAATVKVSSDEKVIESKSSDERTAPSQSNSTQRQAGKSKDSRPRSSGQASNSSVLGVYSSSSDPVHVPSPARSSTNGSFRREVGVVGVRKMPSDNSGKKTSSNAALGKNNTAAESALPRSGSPKGNQSVQNTATGPAVPVNSASRPFSNGNQYGHRSHQQPAGHQKAVQPSKEWKPKSSQKNAVNAELPTEYASPAADVSADGLKDSNIEGGKLSDKHSPRESQGVIIAEHIRVPDVDRCRVTFGSFGLDANLTNCVAPKTVVDAGRDLSPSMPLSASDASNVANTEHRSPESSAADDHQFSDAKDSSLQNSENYADVGMVCSDSTSYVPSELQKQHDIVGVGSYSTFDPQTGYDITYFRQSDDESARGGLSSAQEGFNSHAVCMVPSSQALYQQQAQIPQMYPQVHVSHYMPYRQFIPPVYVPQMGVPGYSPNTAYAHPANGNGYVLMPGGSSHLNANAMKYGAQQQFKPAPGGSPTGFGNYTTPTGYTVNAPGGMMGTAAGSDDPSRHKYKDGNIYVQNPQTEAQELWMQNPREIPGLQSSTYYNMQGQAPPGIYMPSHPAHHAAYNPAAAAAQSSHMQFPGLYHPQAQATPIPTPHHMAPSNLGVVGIPQPAPMAQVAAAYQQSQINHHQWTSNNF